MEQHKEEFKDIKARLDEIVELVNDDELDLDAALVLYEEAVSLGLKATTLLEQDLEADAASHNALDDEDATAADSSTTSEQTDSNGEAAGVLGNVPSDASASSASANDAVEEETARMVKDSQRA